MKRWAPALAAFLLTVAALVQPALTLPQDGDEAQYAWTAAYYGGRLAELDFRPDGEDAFTDPGWSPRDPWALTQPMGTRAVYAIALAASSLPAPALPFAWGNPALQGPDRLVPSETLPALRLVAVLFASVGLAMLAYRLGWPAVLAALLLLGMPNARDDLARAWAEGPLLFGLGLASLSYGTRWFAPTCGLAASFKLTALGLWPLAFHHGFGKGRYSHILGLVLAAATWTAFEPPSWFAGGPSYLVPMPADRVSEFMWQSSIAPGSVGFYSLSHGTCGRSNWARCWPST